MGAALRNEYFFGEPEGETTADEFLEFISLTENQDKTFELIDGYVVMMAGNATGNHQRICGYIARKIGNYLEGKRCEVFQDLNVYLFKKEVGKCKNIFQPDVIIGCAKDKVTDRGYEGTPDIFKYTFNDTVKITVLENMNIDFKEILRSVDL